jgi:hypothetical protein
MIDSPRPAPVDTQSPGADDGATGPDGSAGSAYGPIMTETPEGDIRALRLFSIIGGISVRPR